MQQQYLTIWDVVLTPFYLLILIFIAKLIRNRWYPIGHPLRKYYLSGLWVKFGGVIFIGCIYQFYYGGGDTFNYYKFGKLINETMSDSFMTWLKLIFQISPDSDPYLYPVASQIEFYNDPSAFMIVRLSALLGLLNFNTYMPTGLLFAFISYSGIWAMFRTFVVPYPHLHKQLAIAFLFVPSVFVWGSTILKDTICMFGLGWMTYTSFRIFVNKDFSAKNFLLLSGSFYLIATIKIYILLAFLPSLALWLLLTHSSKIKSVSARIFVIAAIVVMLGVSFVFVSNQFSNQLRRYSLENLSYTIEETKAWIVYSSGDEGSKYDLGEFDGSIGSMVSQFPAAVVVTLFRPFLWEARKPIMLLAALEGFAFMIMFLIVLFRNGVFNVFRLIFASPNLSFFFVFSIIFAFAVGISTGNFGTLSRYRIPCIPFFAAFLVILYFQKKPTVNPTSSSIKNAKRSFHNIS